MDDVRKQSNSGGAHAFSGTFTCKKGTMQAAGGNFAYIFVKSGGTCPLCHPVTTSIVLAYDDIIEIVIHLN